MSDRLRLLWATPMLPGALEWETQAVPHLESTVFLIEALARGHSRDRYVQRMTNTLTAHTTTLPSSTQLARSLARGSWLAPVLAVGFTALVQRTDPALSDAIVLCLLLVGLGCGVAALGLPRARGASGVLRPALLGLVGTGLMLGIFAANVIAFAAQ